MKISFVILLILIIAIIFSIIFWQKVQKKETSEGIKLSRKMKISSPAFEENSKIPKKYTCDGENINPPLEIKEIPEGTQSLVLIVEDPDAPMGKFLHWLVFNIDPKVNFIEENSLPFGSIQGKNDFGQEGYGGPCPPFGQHRYFFKVFALDKKLNLPSGAKLNEIENAMEGHILDQAELIGVYGKI